MIENQQFLQTEEATSNAPKLLENQLMATKFFVPITAGTLIPRARLLALLDQSLDYPLTLIAAPAGFGKTTLLSIWAKSLPPKAPKFAWVSLDTEDNEPLLFWTYVITALNMLQPQRFTPLLTSMQSTQPPPLKYIVRALINTLVQGTEQFLLILDDYHLIQEEQVHAFLSYLIEHLPMQLHIILSSRTKPPLPLLRLRARQRLQEICTDQLRCTAEETQAFFKEVIGLSLPDHIIQEVATRTEGWLAGLYLLGLSLPEHPDPTSLLKEIGGGQHYILDYLTQEVLRKQPQEIQTFLLSTSILERFNAALCDAVLQRTDSGQILEWLEKANLFVVPLGNKRQWYRYHALFAEVLRYRLERSSADLVPSLHHRASLWYAQHDQNTQAILHAFSAKEWHWAADLIERLPVVTLTWGAGPHELVRLRSWLEQLPAEIVHTRSRLCLACSHMLWTVVPSSTLQAWLKAAEVTLTSSLVTQAQQDTSSSAISSQIQQEQKDLLGEVIAFQAYLLGFLGDGQTALPLCQQALTLLSEENHVARAVVCWALLRLYYASSVNDAEAAIQSGVQGSLLAQRTSQTALAITIFGSTACLMVGTGKLRETQQMTKQAIQLGTQAQGLLWPEVGFPQAFQAEILREWNKLDAALALVQEAISLCKETKSMATFTYILCGYAMLLRIALSRGELDTARSALEQINHIGKGMNQSWANYLHSLFPIVDQVKLWLACGELDCATRWAEELDIKEQHGPPFAHEREEVAQARIFLAKQQPDFALQRLEPVRERATTGQRWGHVIEIQILQALAYQMRNEKMQALSLLSEALRLAEPEGYIRSFVDEGAFMEALLNKLREEQRKSGPTPYLDTLLAAFPQRNEMHAQQLNPPPKRSITQPLIDPLSERELQVLQLLAQGASNQQIAQELAIAVDTVKRHLSHTFSKLSVQNRVQAAKRARELGLLD